MKKLITVVCSLSLGIMHAQGAENPKRLSFSALQAIQDKNGSRAITGVATNQSGVVLKNIVVKFNLYDEEGVQIGHTIAQTMDLGPGQDWNLKAPVAVPGMTSFIISKVNADIGSVP